MTRDLRSGHLADNRGQSLVEFSLVVLVLLMLLFGVVEIGRMVLVYTTVANAAKAGVRYAIVNGSDSASPCSSGSTTACVTMVKNFASAGGLNTANLLVSVNYPGTGCPPGVTGTNAPGCWVRVTANYPYDPFLGYFNLPSINLGSGSEGAITW
jgi:Flp pilus assembly protein TadG